MAYDARVRYPTFLIFFVLMAIAAGTGVGYNNNYAGIALVRNGTEYVGTLGGIVAMRDGG